MAVYFMYASPTASPTRYASVRGAHCLTVNGICGEGSTRGACRKRELRMHGNAVARGHHGAMGCMGTLELPLIPHMCWCVAKRVLSSISPLHLQCNYIS